LVLVEQQRGHRLLLETMVQIQCLALLQRQLAVVLVDQLPTPEY
jgi:hypothetical protein